MSITPVPNKGLVVDLDSYVRLKTDRNGPDFWFIEYQRILRTELAPFLPRMVYDADTNSVTASIVDKGKEKLQDSVPATKNFTNVPPNELRKLREVLGDFLQKISELPATSNVRRLGEVLTLPDPNKAPELYRLSGVGMNKKLSIIWGIAPKDASGLEDSAAMVSIRELLHMLPAPKKSIIIPKKWILAGLGALVAALGIGYFLCCNGDECPAQDNTATPGTVTNGTVTNGTVTNGTVTNGTVTNGTATNGTATNGTATNGTATNGTATNGTVTNGTVTNGTVTPGAVSNGTVSNGTVSNGTVSNGTVSNGTVSNGTVSNSTSTTTQQVPVGNLAISDMNCPCIVTIVRQEPRADGTHNITLNFQPRQGITINSIKLNNNAISPGEITLRRVSPSTRPLRLDVTYDNGSQYTNTIKLMNSPE